MAATINLSKCFLIACVLMHAVFANGSNKVVTYWGQESDGKEQPLAHYCATGTYDVIVIGFAYMFPFASNPTSPYPGLNFASHCEYAPDPSNPYLLICPDIGTNITYCQSLGVQIMMSFGGGVGLYGFNSDAQAVTFATTVWNMFLGGTSSVRPFGNAIVDGVDLDIEGGAITGYISFINTLRQYFARSSRTYYITSAPQCVYPDGRLGPGTGTALQSAWFDYVWVQFYNNYCGINAYPSTTYNFNVWAAWARTISVNPNVKVFVGAPAGPNAAGSGYISASALQAIHVNMVANYGDVYGGIMLWDCSNSDNNNNFGGQVAAFVHTGAAAAPVPTPTTPSTTGVKASTSTSGVKASTSTFGVKPATSTTGTKTASTSTSTTGQAVAACTNGNMKCATNATYSICSNGVWGSAQSCQTGLSCVACGNSVLCGHTIGGNTAPATPTPVPTTPTPTPSASTSTSSSSTTCSLGDQQCVGQSTYQTCAVLRDGTTYWGAAQSCQTGLSCHASNTGNNIYCY